MSIHNVMAEVDIDEGCCLVEKNGDWELEDVSDV
jgi:hypothetical protein